MAEHCSRPNCSRFHSPRPPQLVLRARPKLRRLMKNQRNQTRHGTIPFQGLRKTFKGFSLDLLFMYNWNYSLLDNSVGTGYGLLISIKNTMTSTMT